MNKKLPKYKNRVCLALSTERERISEADACRALEIIQGLAYFRRRGF